MIYARNPCMFEQLPAFQAQLRPLSACPRGASKGGSTQLQISTTQTAEGALVTLKKPLEQPSQYSGALQERIAAVRAKYAAAPAYSLVSDVFGNQYYVDNSARVQAQMQEELQAIDMAPVGRRLAKQSFRDYALELSHDGLELTVSSLSDGEQRALRFGAALSDFYVKACTVEDGRVAVLQIGVVLEKQAQSAEKQDSLSALIDWAQQSAGNAVPEEAQCPAIASCAAVNQQKKVQKRARAERAQQAKAQRIQQEKAERIQQAKAQRSEAERVKCIQQAKMEQAQRVEAERAQRMQQAEMERAAAERLAAERLATQRAEHDRAMAARRNAELERERQRDIAETQAIEEQRARIQAMVAEQQARAEAQAKAQAKAQAEAQAKAQAEAQAKAQAEAQAKAQAEAQAQALEQERQRTLQEQAAYQRQLVAEERALKQKRAAASPPRKASAATVTPPASPSASRIAASPVVLEDVDDEETTRYNASVRSRGSSPSRGYTPVVEDA